MTKVKSNKDKQSNTENKIDINYNYSRILVLANSKGINIGSVQLLLVWTLFNSRIEYIIR